MRAFLRSTTTNYPFGRWPVKKKAGTTSLKKSLTMVRGFFTLRLTRFQGTTHEKLPRLTRLRGETYPKLPWLRCQGALTYPKPPWLRCQGARNYPKPPWLRCQGGYRQTRQKKIKISKSGNLDLFNYSSTVVETCGTRG